MHEEDIRVFIEYQKVFFEKEHKRKKSQKYIEGYLKAINDIEKILKNDGRRIKSID